MKNSIKIVLGALVIGASGFASCSDMLETNSSSYLNAADHDLNSANDSLYSVVGILAQIQKLGERYVVVGEARGDLMELTGNAGMDLQDIANFTANADNPYASTREYYAIINNCNYFLQRVDTTIVAGGRKVMLGEYVSVKTFRAWAYMQLALNHGKAVWLTEPVQTINDMNKEYEELSFEPLLERLIQDLSPYLDVTDYPGYGSIDNTPVSYFLIPVQVLYGDLCLWYGACAGSRLAYENAATAYYGWISHPQRFFHGGGRFYNVYTNDNFNQVSGAESLWSNIFTNYQADETISLTKYNLNRRETMEIPPLTLLCIPGNTSETRKVKPSTAALDLWNNETYAFYREIGTQSEVIYTKGDLRGLCSPTSTSTPLGSCSYAGANESDSMIYITKYGYYGTNGFLSLNSYQHLHRAGLLYLRYAEALNALEKPSLALAVLKYGLKPETLNDPKKITPSEIEPLPAYCNFRNSMYSNSPVRGSRYQTGIHSRGSGDVDRDTVYYAFKPEALMANRAYYGCPDALDNLQDSIRFVNLLICKEIGLETAFEGNRFHDLMRLSKTYERLTGKPDFLAKWVARRNPALEGKLLNPDNWYLPYK